MIEVRTNLVARPNGATKRVVMEMSADDAFALATILMNYDTSGYSMEWVSALSKVTRHLIDAGNTCR